MNLLAPWFLAGLGTLAVPVLVHLIQKERKDSIPFPSLMFIESVPYQSVSRQRIRDWLLFLLRCLAVICLVLAFTRPFFTSRNASAALIPNGGKDIVIALDRSYSMGYGDRWRKAISAAKNVVNEMHATDRATVVYFAGSASATGPFTSDKGAVLAALDSVQPTAGGTRYDVLFRAIQNVIGDTARPHREVVLVSDYQRSGWSEHELPRLPVGTTLTQINVGSNVTTNATVTHVDLHYDSSGGHPRVTVQATIANHSAVALQKRPVTFELNGRAIQTRLADCAPNGVSTVVFDAVPAPPGLSRGVVHAGPDSLEADNRFYFLVEQDPSLPVLLVEPPTGDTKTGMFVNLALGIGDRLSFRVKTVRAGQFSADEFRKTSLVVLDGTPIPGGDVGRRLVDYVKNGGGLFVVLGPQSQPSSWPSLADNLLPRPTGSAVDRSADRGAMLEFVDHGHSIFEVFSGPHSGDFSAARFLRYWPMTPKPGDRQLARFDDGRVALLERHVGAGRVLVWSSDMDGAWNDFPVQPVFLPLLHQVAKYAVGYEREQPWETVGDVLNLPTLFGENPHHADSVNAQPSGETQYVAITPSGAQTRYTNASGRTDGLEVTEQGFYDIKRTGAAGDSSRTVAVNVDLTESDLAPLDTAILTAAVSPSVAPGEKMKSVGEIIPGDLEHQQSIWWYLLVMALLLLGAETLLSNRLSRAAR